MHRYTTGKQWYRIYCWWSVTFNLSDLIALCEILVRLCDQQIYPNGLVYSCCIAVPPRKLEWMWRSSSGRRWGKKITSWYSSFPWSIFSVYSCLFFIFNMQTYFAQGGKEMLVRLRLLVQCYLLCFSAARWCCKTVSGSVPGAGQPARRAG